MCVQYAVFTALCRGAEQTLSAWEHKCNRMQICVCIYRVIDIYCVYVVIAVVYIFILFFSQGSIPCTPRTCQTDNEKLLWSFWPRSLLQYHRWQISWPKRAKPFPGGSERRSQGRHFLKSQCCHQLRFYRQINFKDLIVSLGIHCQR